MASGAKALVASVSGGTAEAVPFPVFLSPKFLSSTFLRPAFLHSGFLTKSVPGFFVRFRIVELFRR
jgi:hypothetical protein